jgi:hypothetical protein
MVDKQNPGWTKGKRRDCNKAVWKRENKIHRNKQ